MFNLLKRKNEKIVREDKITEKRDERGNLIYRKISDGYCPDIIHTWKYDENNNLIYTDRKFDTFWWYTKRRYDENNRLIYYNSDGKEKWYRYDENNKKIKMTKEQFKEFELHNFISETIKTEIDKKLSK